MGNALSPLESRLLLFAPELAALLVLQGENRPFRPRHIIEAGEAFRNMDGKRRRELEGFGRLLLAIVGILPPGFQYPEVSPWLMSEEEFENFLKKLPRNLRNMRPHKEL